MTKGIIGADMFLVGNEIVIGLGSSGDWVQDSIAAPIRAPLTGSHNALTALLAAFGFHPQRWAKDARIVGAETVADEPAIDKTASIDAVQFFLDTARFTSLLDTVHASDLALLLKAIGPAARAALARSVASAATCTSAPLTTCCARQRSA